MKGLLCEEANKGASEEKQKTEYDKRAGCTERMATKMSSRLIWGWLYRPD